MYTPGLFEMNSLAEKHALIEANPFALLITQHEGEQHLSHLPFRLDPARGPLGTLEAHVAKQNAHGRAILAGAKSTVVFSGAHAYISPRWYADPTHNVPTWNYLAVHAHGAPVAYEDTARILRVITRLTEEHEAYVEKPWSVSEADSSYIEGLTRGIIAFELPIDALEGKAKLSQNRNPKDREVLLRALRKLPQHCGVLEKMDALYSPDGAAKK
jgi:transcriptional regulator